ncbi:MAG: DUF885 domain-containing protein, partial [Actinomycetota bacterium]|nr:DUF885 domain-containing protein [Actinomycetota bacterium]
MADEILRELAEEYWDTLLEASPTMATVLGDHRFDDRIEELSAGADAARRARWASILERAALVDRSGLDADDAITHGQLTAEVGDAIALIDARLVELASDQMTGFHVDFLQSLPVMSAPDPISAEMLVERFRCVPDALEQSAERFLAGGRAGRTPAAICVTRSINVIEAYLASPLDGDGVCTLAGPPDWDGEAQWRVALRQVAEQAVRPAYLRLAGRLTGELLPLSRDDDHCGLSWLADGPELYAALVAHHTSVDLSADEIHRIGMEEV